MGSKKIIPPFNVIITGNPGIGKSYAAQKIGDLLNASYLLPKSSMINIKKPDVLGQHIGQTAPKTYSVLRKGIGNVIFIDEAYSFAGENRAGHGYDPFGLEFLNALTDFLTEHIGLLCVIAAGYKKEMTTQFLDTNPGLSRRFGIKINLERYTTTYLKLEFNKNLIESASEDIQVVFKYYKNLTNYLEDIINLFDLQLNKKENDKSKNIFFAFVNSDNYLQTIQSSVPSDNEKIDILSIPSGKNILEDKAYDNSNIVDYVYYLNKLNISSGDLFLNQYADIISLGSIVVQTISSNYGKIKQDMDKTEYLFFNDIIMLIILSYFNYKIKLRYNYDYTIRVAKINSDSKEKIVIFFRCPEIENLYNVTTKDKISEIKQKMEKDTQSFSQLDIKMLNSVNSDELRKEYLQIEKTEYTLINSTSDN
jgi:hypothetical protein